MNIDKDYSHLLKEEIAATERLLKLTEGRNKIAAEIENAYHTIGADGN